MYYVSAYFCSIPKDAETAIVWNSVFGQPVVISAEFAHKMQHMEGGFSAEELFSSPDGLNAEQLMALYDFERRNLILRGYGTRKPTAVQAVEAELTEVERLHFIHDVEPCQRKIKSLTIAMREGCEFNCECCVHCASKTQGDKLMTYKDAAHCVDRYMDGVLRNKLDEAQISIVGDENLANWPVVNKLLYDAEDWRFLIPVKLTIHVNLDKLTSYVAKELIRHKVDIVADIDDFRWTAEGKYVIKRKGKPITTAKILSLMVKKNRPLSALALTVTEDNLHSISTRLVDWAGSYGITKIHINPDPAKIDKIDVPYLVERLTKVRAYAKTKDVEIVGLWSRPAENMQLNVHETDVGFCGMEQGSSIAVGPDDFVHPCALSCYDVGTKAKLEEVCETDAYWVLLYNRELTRQSIECQECEILGFCRGGCRAVLKNDPIGLGRHRNMCGLYRAMTRAILREKF